MSSISNSVKNPGGRRHFVIFNKCVYFNTIEQTIKKSTIQNLENSHLTKNEKRSNINVENGLLDYL